MMNKKKGIVVILIAGITAIVSIIHMKFNSDGKIENKENKKQINNL